MTDVTPTPEEQSAEQPQVEAPTQPDSVPTHTSDNLPQIVESQPQATAGDLRAQGYDVPSDIPDDEVPHRYSADTRAEPGAEPILVTEFPPHGTPRWENGKVVGGDEG
jgi:hypothetical protein